MIRIGLIDNQLDNFHANTYVALARSRFADRAAIVGCHALQADVGRTWAQKNGVAWHDDVAALSATVDAWMVLAPSNPELHPELCARVLPTGKPTWVDKTFASNNAAARAIFALADRHRAPIQTSSALRHTNVQEACAAAAERPLHVSTWGPGRSFAEYAIHPVELAVSLLGPQATRVHRRTCGSFDQILIDFSGGRTATVQVHCTSDTPYAAAVTTGTTTRWMPVDVGEIFANSLAATIAFLTSGTTSIDRRESLAIRAILDATEMPQAITGYMTLEPQS